LGRPHLEHPDAGTDGDRQVLAGARVQLGHRHLDQIAQTVAAEHHLSLADRARLFAQVNVASADAFIASFDASTPTTTGGR